MPTKDEIKQFSLMIEQLALKLKCSRMDAILEHCKETGFDNVVTILCDRGERYLSCF